jgi:hypothetical protein
MTTSHPVFEAASSPSSPTSAGVRASTIVRDVGVGLAVSLTTVYIASNFIQSQPQVMAARFAPEDGHERILKQREGNYTVVIPTRNEEKNLPMALQSLLNQSVYPREIIVADTASTDGTRKIAENYGVTRALIDDPAFIGHVGAARDLGTKAAMTPVVMAMDADTLWGPRVAEESIKMIEEDDYDLVHVTGVTDNALANTLYYNTYRKLKPPWKVDGRHIAFKKSVWEELGGFQVPTCETYHLGLKAFRNGYKIGIRHDLPVVFKWPFGKRRAPPCVCIDCKVQVERPASS